MGEKWTAFKAGLKGFVAGILAVLAAILGLKLIGRRRPPTITDPADAGKKATDEVLAQDPRVTLDSLKPETRGRIADAIAAGKQAGRDAAREALHRGRGAGGG